METRRGELIDNELSIPDRDKIIDTSRQIINNLKNDTILSSKPKPLIFSFGDKEDRENNIIESPRFELESGVKVKISGSLPPIYLYPDNSMVFVDTIGGSTPAIRHWLLPFLVNKFLPGSLRAYLVSPKEIYLTEFASDASDTLDHLIKAYVQNLEKPLPLYPELAESLHNKKDPHKVVSIDDFKNMFLDKWMENEAADPFGYSEFKICPYKYKAYSALPQFDEQKLLEFFTFTYKEIFSDIFRDKATQ